MSLRAEWTWKNRRRGCVMAEPWPCWAARQGMPLSMVLAGLGYIREAYQAYRAELRRSP